MAVVGKDGLGPVLLMTPEEAHRWESVKACCCPKVVELAGEGGLTVRMLRSLPLEKPSEVAKALETSVNWRVDDGVDGMLSERVHLWERFSRISLGRRPSRGWGGGPLYVRESCV